MKTVMMPAAIAALTVGLMACQSDTTQPKAETPPTQTASAPAKKAEAPKDKAPKADPPRVDECSPFEGAVDVTDKMKCLSIFDMKHEHLVTLETKDALDALVKKYGERCKDAPPSFDFEKVMLMGAVTTGTCNLSVTAKVCQAVAGPQLSIKTMESGECERMAMHVTWMSIPKVAEGKTPSLQIKREEGK